MNPLRIAGWAVSWLCDWLVPPEKPWPDGEQPLIDEPPLIVTGEFPSAGQEFGLVTDVTDEPLPGGFRWGCTDHESSVPAGSASEARDEPTTEGPTPESALPQPGVGHPKLLRASAIQLEEWSQHIACPAAIYCGSLARQLREMATRFDNSSK